MTTQERLTITSATTPLEAWQLARQDLQDYLNTNKKLLTGRLTGPNGTHCALGVWTAFGIVDAQSYGLEPRYDGIAAKMPSVMWINDDHALNLMADPDSARQAAVFAWIDDHIKALS